MTDTEEKLALLVEQSEKAYSKFVHETSIMPNKSKFIADNLISNGVTVQEPARPLEEWWEAYGDVLWWKFPIEEPPYVGSPLDENWPGYHTHWTPIPLPELPKGE